MSGKESSSAKVTLAMQKGKSITTSVPSFAIHFHSGGEELDEVNPSADGQKDDIEKSSVNIEFQNAGNLKNNNLEETGKTPISLCNSVPSSSTEQTSSSLGTATSANSIASAPSDPSPMKEYFKGIGKRSTSMDAGIIDVSSGSDAGWRIFHEWKGKITKRVEEKFSDRFSDKKLPAMSNSSESSRRGRLGSGSGYKSKENSSVSEDETSESLNQIIDEAKIPEESLLIDDKLISVKTSCSSKSLIEDKQSLSLDEKDDVLSDSLTDPPSTSSAFDVSDLTDISSKGLIKKSGFRNRMKHNLSGLRHRHKVIASDPIDSKIVMSSLSASVEEFQSDNDIEAAIEASEDIKFNKSQKVDDLVSEEANVMNNYRTNLQSSHTSFKRPMKFMKSYFGLFLTLWSCKFIISGFVLCLYSIFYDVSPLLMGFIWGLSVGCAYYAVRDLIRGLVMPKAESQLDLRRLSLIQNLSVDLPILNVPAAKEYQPLIKYEGWMNEYPDTYDPETYSISATHSVYVRLEGSTLRVSNTRLKIPKRAMWNERKHKLRFTHQRIYNIANCSIKLLPEGLTRRRIWSKKYPICIVLLDTSALKSCIANIMKETVSDDETSKRSGVDSEGLDLFSQGSPDSRSDIEENSIFDTRSGENKSFDEEDISIPDDISDEDTFCHVDKSSLEGTCLYLFARTDREKEDWYRRFCTASKFQSSVEEEGGTGQKEAHITQELPLPEVVIPKVVTLLPNNPAVESQEEQTQSRKRENLEDIVHPEDLDDHSDYLKFMSVYKLQVLTNRGKCILKSASSPKHAISSPHQGSKQKIDIDVENTTEHDVAPDLMWFNAFIGRILFDFMKNPVWVLKLQERIQKKLSAIKLPHFVGEIVISELCLGEAVPLIHCASAPMLDERGLWTNIDVTYKGNVSLTLETKLNLLKLKKEQPSDTSSVPSPSLSSPSPPDLNRERRSSPMFDSDLDDSAESSDDDSDFDKSSTDEEYVGNSGQNPGSTGKRILRIVNKIAASKYFQQATDYKYIKRAMEEVSNTRIILSVEVKGLSGTLTLNIPPPPSDRLWYGFVGCPSLALSARPKFGERQVNISHVVSWIEKQLVKEFQKKLVLPNMDDIVIGPMKDTLPK